MNTPSPFTSRTTIAALETVINGSLLIPGTMTTIILSQSDHALDTQELGARHLPTVARNDQHVDQLLGAFAVSLLPASTVQRQVGLQTPAAQGALHDPALRATSTALLLWGGRQDQHDRGTHRLVSVVRELAARRGAGTVLMMSGDRRQLLDLVRPDAALALTLGAGPQVGVPLRIRFTYSATSGQQHTGLIELPGHLRVAYQPSERAVQPGAWPKGHRLSREASRRAAFAPVKTCSWIAGKPSC